MCAECFTPSLEIKYQDHNETQCTSFLQKIKESERGLCPIHSEYYLVGKICPSCHPYIKVQGISRSNLENVKKRKENDITFTVYTITNTNVNYVFNKHTNSDLSSHNDTSGNIFQNRGDSSNDNRSPEDSFWVRYSQQIDNNFLDSVHNGEDEKRCEELEGTEQCGLHHEKNEESDNDVACGDSDEMIHSIESDNNINNNNSANNSDNINNNNDNNMEITIDNDINEDESDVDLHSGDSINLENDPSLPPLITECRMRGADVFAFSIRDPSLGVAPHLHLTNHLNDILRDINNSELIRPHPNESYRMFIWAHSTFVRVKGDEENKPLDECNKKKHNTTNVFVPGFQGGVKKSDLTTLIYDLATKYNSVENSMNGSGWAFVKSDNIKIVFANIYHKNVEKTWGSIVKKYQQYPSGFRGSCSVVNFNYEHPVFENKCKRLNINHGASPCVSIALKCHFVNINENLLNKVIIIDNLRRNQNYKKYTAEAVDTLLNTKINIPTNLFNDGIQLKDIGVLERGNKVPIALYYLRQHKTEPDKMCITTLRAPKSNIIKEYGVNKICHLALISSDHVVYIPDMASFMKKIFKSGEGDRDESMTFRRCHFCFAVLRSKDMLRSHIVRGICTTKSSQPARIIMPKPGSLISHKPSVETEAPFLTVVIDTESRLVPPDSVPISDFVFDTSPFEDSTVTLQDNIIHYHIPQSVGLLFLNSKMEKLGYHCLIGDNVQYTFPDSLTRYIDMYWKEVEKHMCTTPYLTDDEEKYFVSTTHCQGCKTPFDSLKKILNIAITITGSFLSKM